MKSNTTLYLLGLVAALCGNIAAASCPILVGRLFEWTANWNLVLLLFSGVFFAGALSWAFVNPQHRVR